MTIRSFASVSLVRIFKPYADNNADGENNMSNFNTWIDTFLEEKNIDTEQTLRVEGPSGLNMMPIGVVVEAMKNTLAIEQEGIKKTLVQIDFKNGDPVHFIKHLAQALAQ